MKGPVRSRWLLAGAAASAPALLMPVGDPDLWWHLRAAGEILASRAVPSVESWSRTMAGTPWIDFEWLSQLVLWAVHAATGLGGLWLLKAALLAASGAAVVRVAGRRRLSVPVQAAALALWAAAVIPRSDIRTELFSVLAFSWLFAALEERADRNSRLARVLLSPAGAAVLFAFWANLHAAFTYGLVLLGAYALADSLDRAGRGLWKTIAAGAAATLLNPYGWGLHAVLLRHFLEAPSIAPYILEWAPLSPFRPAHWPSFLLLIAAAVLLARVVFNERGGKRPETPLVWAGVLAVFGFTALRHARVSVFFCTLAVPLLAALAAETGLLPRGDALRRRLAAAAALLFAAGFSIGIGRRAGVLRAVSHTVYTPVGAAAFLARNPDLAGLDSYHPWGWGGYFGYAVPRMRVFQDGRYPFHPLLVEAGGAIRSARGWGAFLDKYACDLTVMENRPLLFDTTRVYPDGSSRTIRRPYYLTFMPRKTWALVYFDEQAVIFLRRGAASPARLEALEYLLHRPRDGAALADALRRGEIDTGLLERERERHRAELASLPVRVERP